MIAALVLATAATSDYAARFWERDLGGLVRSLAVDRSDGSPEHALFSDLVRLISCEPLGDRAIASLTPPEAALRLEAARRIRLGPQAAQAPTVWRDILSPRFFQRDTSRDEPTGPLLQWPDDDEPWPGEVLHVEPIVSHCDAFDRSASELEILTPDLIKQAEAGGWAELATRLAYHDAVLLLRAGRDEEAREMAAHVSPALLPAPLGAFARLMRLESGIDPREGYAALIDDPSLGPARLEARVQQCATLETGGRWGELVKLTAPAMSMAAADSGPAAQAQIRYLLAERARALQRLGQADSWTKTLDRAMPLTAADDAAADDAAADALRDSTLAWIVETQVGPDRVPGILARLGPPERQLEYWKRLGDEAFASGNATLLSTVGDHLLAFGTAYERAAGLACHARAAFTASDLKAFDRSVDGLFPATGHLFASGRDHASRDDVAIVLAENLLDATAASGQQPGWRKRLNTLLDLCQQNVGWGSRARVKRLRAAFDQLESRATPAIVREMTVGEVRISRHAAPLSPPTSAIGWPEVYSLLAIPTASGEWRDWFSQSGH